MSLYRVRNKRNCFATLHQLLKVIFVLSYFRSLCKRSALRINEAVRPFNSNIIVLPMCHHGYAINEFTSKLTWGVEKEWKNIPQNVPRKCGCKGCLTTCYDALWCHSFSSALKLQDLMQTWQILGFCLYQIVRIAEINNPYFTEAEWCISASVY